MAKKKPKGKIKKLTPEEAGLVKRPDQRMPKVNIEHIKAAPVQALQYRTLQDGVITLTQEVASRYMDLPILKEEREPKDRDIQAMYDKMVYGVFNESSCHIATVTVQGTEYRLNGSHTCWALLLMKAGTQYRVRYTKYAVDDMQQAAILYGTFDTGKHRTEDHILTVGLVSRPVMEGIKTTVIKALKPGLLYWYLEASPTDIKRITTDQINSIIDNDVPKQWRSVSLFFQDLTIEERRHLSRTPAVGAMFATFDKDETAAVEFWSAIASGVGIPNKQDPRYRLRDKLLRTVLHASPNNTKEHITSEDMFKYCVHAWNHWRNGSEINSLRLPNGPIVPE